MALTVHQYPADGRVPRTTEDILENPDPNLYWLGFESSTIFVSCWDFAVDQIPMYVQSAQIESKP
jgi:hypothetical protein